MRWEIGRKGKKKQTERDKKREKRGKKGTENQWTSSRINLYYISFEFFLKFPCYSISFTIVCI